MSTPDHSSLMTIGQAVETLAREFPDVTVSSLRFLEREGLLTLERKPGGHRLFSIDDLERARTIKRWQSQRLSLKEIRQRLDHAHDNGDIDLVVEHMIMSLHAHDIATAMEMLEDLQQSGTSLLTICDHVLTPVLRSMGDEQGRHLIPVDMQMELDQRIMLFLANVAQEPVQRPGRPIVLAACPLWERHDIPMRMLCALLVERGASVHFIGDQIDQTFILDANSRLQPDIVLVSLTVPFESSAAQDWFSPIIAAMQSDQRFLVGGMGAGMLPDHIQQHVEMIGASTFAATLERVMDRSALVTGQR